MLKKRIGARNMYNADKFNNYEFIKLDELKLLPDTKIVLIYAHFMHGQASDWTIQTHSHSFYELHFALSGSCSLCLRNTQETVLNAGDYLLINPNTNHKFNRISNDFFRLSVVFDIQHGDKVLTNDDAFSVCRCSEKINGFLAHILTECETQDLGYSNIVNFYIQAMMIAFLRENPDILSIDKNNEKDMRNILKDALSFIRGNISQSITACDVSESVNLSSRQLNRIFNSNINMTVAEFIRHERIYRVREHLKKTNLTLQEIASLTGFNDEYVLCKTFKKLTGITPGKYRTKHIKKGLENHYEKFN